MAPVIHCSAGNIRLFHGTSFIARNDIHLTKYSASRKYARLTCCRRFPSPQSSLGLFQISRSGSGSKYRSEIQTEAAVGTDVTVEELSPAVSGDKADETLESPPKPVETTEAPLAGSAVNTTPRIKRARPGRKSDMPPVKDEELVAGASFTGKVRSIQPFGAFVDFGAFTDGLVHVSRISDGYVKDIGAVVSIGQEVKVRIVEANMESRRISLTMRDGDDTSKPQQRPDVSSSGSSDKSRPARSNAGRPNQKRGDVQKSKFVKGQVLDGTVKKLTRSGAFVSLPEGEEGFLPVSEESEGFDSILGNSSLTVGQEVNVRVLRLTRGVTLTMKKEEDVAGLNKQLNQGVVHVATNPFELAFRKNKDIAAFLEEQKKSQKVSENLSTPETSDPKDVGDALKLDGSTVETGKDQINVSSVSPTLVGDKETTPAELNEETTVDSVSGEPVSNEEEPTSSSVLNATAIPEIIPEEGDDSETVIKSSSDSVSDEPPLPTEAKETDVTATTEPELVSESLSAEKIKIPSIEEGDDSETVIKSSSDSVSDELPLPTEAKETDVTTTTEPELVSESLSAEKIEIPSIEEVATAEETNVDTQSSGEISDQVLSSEGVLTEEVASSQPDDISVRDTMVAETPQLVETEKSESDSNDILVRDTVVAETPQLVETEKSESDSKDEIVNASETGSSDQAGETKATISPSLVKQLREESGAGMMDCKKALTETEGDIVKAQELLRKKGLASADKKASRATAEGRIGAYIHDSRIGVLIEVNCETDFVARGEIFKELVDDLAMQVAACPQVRYLSTEDVPEEFVKKEREIEMQKEDLLTKPEQIRSKIVDGRIKKRLEEFALLEQPYIKNDKMVVKDFVKQTIATVGENINVKRFVRYNLGEGLEKKSQDFAAEVAAQTAAKPSSAAAPKEQPAEVKVEKAQTVTVSAALVKQLRDETGAGMMDCKKALTETGGDLEKAQEYLRKKGLSSADKKSSRLAVEGRISSYIHDSRIGVLIEVNSETDFVARNEKFKEMVDNLAMQVVACPQVEYVSVEDIPESIVRKEKELEMEREDLKSKPEPIREKIVEGRISKRLGELALLEQAFIKDDSVTVKDLVKQTVAALGENMRVRRFVRFTLGEN